MRYVVAIVTMYQTIQIRSVSKALGLLVTAALIFGGCVSGCEHVTKPGAKEPSTQLPKTPEQPHEPTAPKTGQVPVWQGGKIVAHISPVEAEKKGLTLFDLGDDWTPYVFSEQSTPNDPVEPNTYRAIYLKLAKGEFPPDRHGDKARYDKYLELYGILPTVTLLRTRMHEVSQLVCQEPVDLSSLASFDGNIVYKGQPQAKKSAEQHRFLEHKLGDLTRKYKVASIDALLPEMLSDKEKPWLTQYKDLHTRFVVISAVQARLECEGYFKGKGKYIPGGMDWATHEALAEFERRQRVYGWGFIAQKTIDALRIPAMQLEYEAVVRVLTERAMHEMAVLEDGSTQGPPEKPTTYVGRDGKRHALRNLEAEIRQSIIAAFGLSDPEATLKWLDQAAQNNGAHRWIAFKAPTLPEYYTSSMQLDAVINRGDVYYDFPYDDHGREIPQPKKVYPSITLRVRYNNQWIPLARYGTTIGGWRSEFSSANGQTMWRYKESNVGERVWKRIVAAPIWVPPESTPPASLLTKYVPPPGKRRKASDPDFVVDYDEIGPGYASAYGLVIAYHNTYYRKNGLVIPYGDEGIRTHGSVDYMSIRRRDSHGCHRLHNHLAVRLMSFVLRHQPHHRLGQEHRVIERVLEHEDETYNMLIKEGGYVYELDQPMMVNVLEGNIKGKLKSPITIAIPKFNQDWGAYMTPEGGAVVVRGNQLVAVPPPPQPYTDAGVPIPLPGAPAMAPAAPDAGVPAAPVQPIQPTQPASPGGFAAPATTPPPAPANPAAPKAPAGFGAPQAKPMSAPSTPSGFAAP